LPGPELRTRLLGGLEQDLKESPHRVAVAVVVSQVVFDLGDGVAEDVQAIPELIELVTSHDELVLAETELVGASTRLVAALATGSLAVLAGTPDAFGLGEPAATPPAPPLHQ